MKLIKKDIINYDNFQVLDEDNNAITGLIDDDFIIKLYNSNNIEVSSSIPITMLELEDGFYRISFIPDLIGNWLLVIYHSIYFPYGKAEDYNCYKSDMNDLYLIKEKVDTINQISSGNWKMINNQLIIYEENGNTILLKFNLLNDKGKPAMTGIVERKKV